MEEKFGIVLALGIAVFGLVFVLQSADGEFLQEKEETEQVFVDKSYGTLGESNPDDRTIKFGDFTVGELRGNVRAYSNEKASISDSLFGGDSVVFRYNATQPRDGNVTFEVLGREGKGEVYVDVNGERVFSEALIATGSPEVKVDRRHLKPGINKFEIGVKRDSFFGSTTYSLEEIEAKVNDRKFHDYEDTFQIYSYELEDYVESPLTFTIDRSVKTSPLEIYVNDNRVYSKSQVRSQEQVEITPRMADLHTGANEIRFETESPAEYVVKNAQITMRYVGNVERQDVEFNFELSSAQKDLVDEEGTSEKIEFKYQNLLPSPRPVKISVNDFEKRFTPENGVNTVELPEETLKEENDFAFRSNGTYQLNRLSIYSEGEE